MSTFKWFLLTICLVLGPEVSSRMWSPALNQPDGFYCNRICEAHGFTGEVALCILVFEKNIKTMIARNPTSTKWLFYPLNSGNQNILVRNPDSLCDRIHKGDRYNGERRCYVPVHTKYRHVFNFGGNGNSFNTTFTHRKSGNCNNLKFLSRSAEKDWAAEMEMAVNQALKNIYTSSRRSASGSASMEKDVEEIVKRLEKIKQVANTDMPSETDLSSVSMGGNTTTYTSEKWANLTATLEEIRDKAEKDEQPDLKELASTLNEVLPVLNAVNITTETKPSPHNEKYLNSLVDMVKTIGAFTESQKNSNTRGDAIPHSLSAQNNGGQSPEEKESIADDLNSKLEKVKEDAAKSDVEVPKGVINDMDKEVKRLSSALSSVKKRRSDFSSVFKILKDILDAFRPLLASGNGNVGQYGNQFYTPNQPPFSNPMAGEEYPPNPTPMIGDDYRPFSNQMTGDEYRPYSNPMNDEGYPEMSNPMFGEKYPPDSNPMIGDNYRPTSNPMIGEEYPPFPSSMTGETYSPYSNPMIGEKYPPFSNELPSESYSPFSSPMAGEKYPPDSSPMTNENYSPYSNPMIGEEYPPFSNELPSESYSPYSNPMAGESYSSFSNPMIGEKYPPNSNPMIGDNYRPISNPMIGEGYSRYSNRMAGEGYPPNLNSMIGGSYSPYSNPMISEKYPPRPNPMMGDKYPPKPNPMIGQSYSTFSNPMAGEEYPFNPNSMIGGSYSPYLNPMISEKYPPKPNPMIGQSYSTFSNPIAGEEYSSNPNSMIGGSYSPYSNPLISEKYPPRPNSMMGDKYPARPNPMTGDSYPPFSNSMSREIYQPIPKPMMGKMYRPMPKPTVGRMPGRYHGNALRRLVHSKPRTYSRPPYLDIGTPLEMCKLARKFFCQEHYLTVYTVDNYFCWSSLRKSHICKRLSMNCFQDLDFMLDPVQYY